MFAQKHTLYNLNNEESNLQRHPIKYKAVFVCVFITRQLFKYLNIPVCHGYN